MNAKQLKERVLIPDYLGQCGFEPVKRLSSGDLRYFSPIRSEKTPSFDVSEDGKKFIDRGRATELKGSVIDLVCYLHRTNLEGAIEHLTQWAETNGGAMKGNRATAPPPLPPPEGKSGALEGFTVKPLAHPALIAYVEKRGIPQKVVVKYLYQANYTVRGKRYFALAFRNEAGGFELRNEYFKGSHGKKAVSFFKGEKSHRAAVFEGFFDYLAALVHFNRKRPPYDVFVLNGLGQLAGLEKRLTEYQAISLFLDNDESGAGQQHAQRLKDVLGDRVADQAQKLYPSHKDMNAFLLAQKPESSPETQHLKLNQNAQY